MGATILNGPLHISGDMQAIPASLEGTTGVVVDPNTDAGPSQLFQGYSAPDVRYVYLKDKVQGYTGVVPETLAGALSVLANQIPATHSTTIIAAAQTTTTATPMTLSATFAAGYTPAIPVIPFSGGLNTGTPVATAAALDFGFAFGNCTAGSATIQVADSKAFEVGYPLVIGGVGNSGGTAALLTQVASIVDGTHITVAAGSVPLATNATAPIGTGNLWGPSENGFPLPTAALPYLAKGPGLFLDPRQAIARGLVITCNNSSGTGGNITVVGYDVYGQVMSEKIAIVPASSLSGYGKKAFKYIVSATPDFTDATFTYALGTSDVFGFSLRSDYVELSTIWWNAGLNAAGTGWTVADTTSPATNLTGDVRGTIQTSAIGGGSGIGATATNGTISSLAMSGRRLMIAAMLNVPAHLRATSANPQFAYGVTQA